ncbi:MAG: hypothetical protein LUD70_06235 [Bacteroides ovatus]|nr:hypothetical protein [Bacteroides ovatus]
MKRNPQIYGRYSHGNPVHRHILTPQSPTPAFDNIRHFNVPDTRIVCQFPLMHQRNDPVMTINRQRREIT